MTDQLKTTRKRKSTKIKGEFEKKIKLSNKEDEFDNDEIPSCSGSDTPLWKDYELISEQLNIEKTIISNIINLLEKENTIPFIARYRKNETNNMSPEMLREVKKAYEDICNLKSKMQAVIKNLTSTGVLDKQLKYEILRASSLEELEYLYAPFKPGSKQSLAERAKELGLNEPAQKLINNVPVNIANFVDVNNPNLQTIQLAEKGIVHIIASCISSDTEVLTYLKKLEKDTNFMLEAKKSTRKTKNSASTSKIEKPTEHKNTKSDESKYENYFDFKCLVRNIKPHQILAINRGETKKILTVKLDVPDFLYNQYWNFCTRKWYVRTSQNDTVRTRLFHDAIKDSYTRLVHPLLIRRIRSELKLKAESASHEVFGTNLKRLLLQPPTKGKNICGIDPGFKNGCKMAVISDTGVVLSFFTIYPHRSPSDRENGRNLLVNMLIEFSCSLIALGNGTACRETEKWLTDLIKTKVFAPLDVSYAIVNEDGASIYSCSAEAKKEFPDMDTNIISAVSLARRLQDPLAELVKVEPQHLGVGMYQHDMRKKQLENVLNEVVLECVSFVGVDINTASQCLLRKIAGLSDKRATLIIEHRKKKGPFLCRKQLLEVTGIGKRTFEQCAGFLKICLPNVANKLDCTYIHPESYELATNLIKKLNLDVKNIGKSDFIQHLKNLIPCLGLEKLSAEFKTTKETLDLIFDSLTKPLNYDLRSAEAHIPLFRKGLTDVSELKVGTVLTGRIVNVTHFGSFVDIGVGMNGLIHVKHSKGLALQVADKVEVEVNSIELERKRIGLMARKKI